MTDKNKIEQAIIDFVKGGDESNVELLNKVLHQDFTVNSYNFMGTNTVKIISKEEYLSNIREGKFGGKPREMNIESIDISGAIAMVKLHIESSDKLFVTYNSLVLDIDKEWKIINNLAVVESKAK